MAMAGIAEMFKKNTGDEYLAGLWRSRIVEGLNWVVLDPTSRPQNSCRVPPWSWAAVDSSVLPQRTNLPRDEDLVDIIDAKSHPGQTSSRSQLVKGSIQLRGGPWTVSHFTGPKLLTGSEKLPVNLLNIFTA
ncbi:hypothetical protein FOPG_08161 [Fusarium oxysporum f. sp. conglutinans race 2 54008]|uniref:Uncharacterized protein n=1 Tax=Fusarium oxysporum f. sp. conglutinans race 2 54008 TaxID=1089457 RepID=X0IWN8_FUSOX|nr:hypothetical protein FOPG_08161 [Fusarium oxysporum f. sp. conglutinans race 2 54008]